MYPVKLKYPVTVLGVMRGLVSVDNWLSFPLVGCSHIFTKCAKMFAKIRKIDKLFSR